MKTISKKLMPFVTTDSHASFITHSLFLAIIKRNVTAGQLLCFNFMLGCFVYFSVRMSCIDSQKREVL